jgi:hypothetical protein
MATIEVPANYDLVKIATAAGQPDPEKRCYHDGVLEVQGVTQKKLNAALASYNYSETELENAAATALSKRDALLVDADKATAGMADAYVAGLLDEADAARFKSYAVYKLALRNIDQQSGYPTAIDWPLIPDV